MQLLIVSHTPHYLRNGVIVGWGATVREIDEMAALFERVVHVAPLYSEAAPASAMPYRAASVKLQPVTPAGGERLRDKLRIPLRYPGYLRTILQECRAADVIHVRAPANISLLALLLLGVRRHPQIRWIKYAGDWNRKNNEPWSYRFQRWWLLKKWHRGIVTVNGRTNNQPAHIRPFLNPCLTQGELDEGAAASREKELCQPVRLLFVGRIEQAKGADVCLEILAQLGCAGIAAQLEMIGEGEKQEEFEKMARDLGVEAKVKFHGGVPRDVLSRFYTASHFILLPSASEGWPKVLSEAMAYGVVPIATAVGSIAEYLADFYTGQAIDSREARLFSDALTNYLREPARWREHSRNAVKAAQKFSYGNYLRAVRELLHLPLAAATTVT